MAKQIFDTQKTKDDARRVLFRSNQAANLRSANKAKYLAKWKPSGFGPSDVSTGMGILRLGSRAFLPAAIMATAMEVGLKPLEYTFNKSLLQENVKGALDMFVSEVPMIASFATFAAVDAAVTGKIGSGSAGGVLGKIVGRGKGGGGIRGKAIGFVAGMVAATLSSALFKPLQDSLGGYISSQRTLGLESAISKGKQAEIEASIRKIAKEKGISGERNISELAKSLNVPTDIRGMNTAQMMAAERQNNRSLRENRGGFFDALGSGNLIKWSEEDDVRSANQAMRVEKDTRRVSLMDQIHYNNQMIIEFYSRE